MSQDFLKLFFLVGVCWNALNFVLTPFFLGSEIGYPKVKTYNFGHVINRTIRLTWWLAAFVCFYGD